MSSLVGWRGWGGIEQGQGSVPAQAPAAPPVAACTWRLVDGAQPGLTKHAPELICVLSFGWCCCCRGSQAGSLEEPSDLLAASSGTPVECTMGGAAFTPPDRSPAAAPQLRLPMPTNKLLLRSRSEGTAAMVASSSSLLDSPSLRSLEPVAEDAAHDTGADTAPVATPARQRLLPPRSPQGKVFVLKGVHSDSTDSLSGSHDSPHGCSAMLAEHVSAVHLGR